MNENKLTNDFLDLRSQSSGKGIVYAILDGTDSVSIFSPKHVMNTEDTDEFFRFLLRSSEFQGRIENPSSVWTSIVKNPWSRDFYRFNLKDSYIELTTTKMSEIIKTPL